MRNNRTIKLKMNSFLALIAIACLTPIAFSQQQQLQQQDAEHQHPHNITRRQARYNCVTPENYYGQCVTLSYCPQVANVFNTQTPQVAQRYIIAIQRSCGTRSVNGDPVVCCTRPSARPVGTPRPTQPAPTSRTTNPFLPTSVPVTTRRSTPPPPPPPPTPTPTPEPTSAAIIDTRATYCRTPDADEGSCIALEKCSVLLKELYVKQTDTEFANYLRSSNVICGSTGSIVCCPSSRSGTTQAPRPQPKPYTNEVPRRLPTPEEGCGNSPSAFKRIVGGEPSKIGAWPWAALLGYDDDLSGSPFKCGGALVTARHVVTAAHCMRKDLSFVRLGEHDLSTDTETRHVDIKVVRREVHPQYNKRNGRSDIALLYLERNVQITDMISPICLPITEKLRRKNYQQFMPFVVGWGKTMEGGTSSQVLQQLQIPIYNNQVCRESYKRQNRLITEDQFDEAIVCAGALTGGKDTCQGDSGGPLMVAETYGANNYRFYLLGVVSYGIGCARPDIPGVYTSVQYFMDWIIQKVADSY